jgi:hypothetical protein
MGCPHALHSDVYSLGLVLWEIISGRTPFAEITNPDIVRNAVSPCPPPTHPCSPSLTPQDPERRETCDPASLPRQALLENHREVLACRLHSAPCHRRGGDGTGAVLGGLPPSPHLLHELCGGPRGDPFQLRVGVREAGLHAVHGCLLWSSEQHHLGAVPLRIQWRPSPQWHCPSPQAIHAAPGIALLEQWKQVSPPPPPLPDADALPLQGDPQRRPHPSLGPSAAGAQTGGPGCEE